MVCNASCLQRSNMVDPLEHATLKGANRYAILYRIGTAKKPETRARPIAEFVAMLERGETIHGS